MSSLESSPQHPNKCFFANPSAHTPPLPLGWTQRQHIGKWHLDQHSEALQSVKCVKAQTAVAAKPLPLELCRMDRQWCFIKGISNSNTAILGYLCYISRGSGNSLIVVNSEQGSLEWLFIILAILDCRISKILQKNTMEPQFWSHEKSPNWNQGSCRRIHVKQVCPTFWQIRFYPV